MRIDFTEADIQELQIIINSGVDVNSPGLLEHYRVVNSRFYKKVLSASWVEEVIFHSPDIRIEIDVFLCALKILSIVPKFDRFLLQTCRIYDFDFINNEEHMAKQHQIMSAFSALKIDYLMLLASFPHISTQILLQYFPEMDNLQKFKFQDEHIIYNMDLLNNVISSFGNVISIDLSYNYLGGEAVEVAKTIVKNIANIQEIDLEHNRLGVYAIDVARELSSAKNLKKICLANNSINKFGVYVAKEIAKSLSITEIDLRGNNLKELQADIAREIFKSKIIYNLHITTICQRDFGLKVDEALAIVEKKNFYYTNMNNFLDSKLSFCNGISCLKDKNTHIYTLQKYFFLKNCNQDFFEDDKVNYLEFIKSITADSYLHRNFLELSLVCHFPKAKEKTTDAGLHSLPAELISNIGKFLFESAEFEDIKYLLGAKNEIVSRVDVIDDYIVHDKGTEFLEYQAFFADGLE